MPQHEIRVPLITNTDDSVKLVSWHAEVGAHLAAGAVVATLETDKAAMEVACETAGFLRWRAESPRGLVPVGSVLAILTALQAEPFAITSGPPAGPTVVGGLVPTRRITLKARALARSLSIALEELERNCSGDFVGEEAVRAYAKRRGALQARAAGLAELDVADGRAALIVGDGAHARYLLDTCARAAACRVVGCVSNELGRGEHVGTMTVLGTDKDLAALRASGVQLALVGVGSERSGARTNERRQRIFERLKELGFEIPIVIDPDASVSPSARLSEGCVVGARAVVSANAEVGKNCLINVGALVCHDVLLEDHVHVTPGAILAASVQVGAGSTIGMGATVLDGTRVGRQCLVPNNARVIRDLPDGTTAPHV